MKKKISPKLWVEQTIKRYGKLVLEYPWECLFLTQDYLKKKNEKSRVFKMWQDKS